jgi:hypothetical protein
MRGGIGGDGDRNGDAIIDARLAIEVTCTRDQGAHHREDQAGP